MHILIVEDDEVARDYLAKGLREVGHSVDVAANGIDGLRMASSTGVDLAIVDRMLPKLDGLALVQSLRATGRKMPVLILSALGARRTHSNRPCRWTPHTCTQQYPPASHTTY